MITHLSTLIVAASVVTALLARRLWAHLVLLYLMCIAVVFESRECVIPAKYAWVVLKILAFVVLWRFCRPRLRPVHLVTSLALAAAYLCLVDVRRAYGCVPSRREYATTLVVALVAWGVLARLA